MKNKSIVLSSLLFMMKTFIRVSKRGQAQNLPRVSILNLNLKYGNSIRKIWQDQQVEAKMSL